MAYRPSPFLKYRDPALLILLLAFSFALVEAPEEVRFQPARLVYRVLAWPSDGVTRLAHYLTRTASENEKLREEVMSLRFAGERAEEILRENGRLRTLLGFHVQDEYQFLPAELLSYPLRSHERHLIRIDKGSADGVETGMPVVSYQGLVGRIESLGDESSEVLMINSKHFSLGARDLRSRVLGAFKWNPRLGFFIDRVAPSEDVRVGDRFVTLGLEGKIPPGFLLGRVSEVRKHPASLRQEILIEAAAPLLRIEDLFVVTRASKGADGFPAMEGSGR
ncbi:MAG: rod shape-determining protein MreC [Candidatus Krumholzibacteria bacterium]|jgi:rod shape-determining protein MreC|nr:rod shape-determining protein MreC [Candidatus Krumholzibacteria bacterium]MDP6669779.1 rod shape-determining protein MreC [Candidatus Krumholzibacteria bacterium]MDP6797700.1 rod shape-determining protein MreC [Candidatus Krumholzibacteria bacterium]MDP7021162.1 rod shape-determining protein MreC [Candidatus Krumholzibacteria bacterium]